MPNPTAFVLAWSLILVACGAEQGRESPAADADGAGQSPAPAASATEMSGQDAYNMVCAGCHETGKDGAPVTGNPEDWENRSQLWQAVLMEHANAGYLEMPARGGDEALSDWTINAATQYMLEITFPDQPGD